MTGVPGLPRRLETTSTIFLPLSDCLSISVSLSPGLSPAALAGVSSSGLITVK